MNVGRTPLTLTRRHSGAILSGSTQSSVKARKLLSAVRLSVLLAIRMLWHRLDRLEALHGAWDSVTSHTAPAADCTTPRRTAAHCPHHCARTHQPTFNRHDPHS